MGDNFISIKWEAWFTSIAPCSSAEKKNIERAKNQKWVSLGSSMFFFNRENSLFIKCRNACYSRLYGRNLKWCIMKIWDAFIVLFVITGSFWLYEAFIFSLPLFSSKKNSIATGKWQNRANTGFSFIHTTTTRLFLTAETFQYEF